MVGGGGVFWGPIPPPHRPLGIPNAFEKTIMSCGTADTAGGEKLAALRGNKQKKTNNHAVETHIWVSCVPLRRFSPGRPIVVKIDLATTLMNKSLPRYRGDAAVSERLLASV